MSNRAVLETVLAQGLVQMQLSVSDDAAAKLIDYIELLYKWNQKHNLTAVRDPQKMVQRHLLDSLSVIGLLDSIWDRHRRSNLSDTEVSRQLSVLDVGSGAGLPGLVLAIVRPCFNVTMVDSVAKKISFIRQAALQGGLSNATAVHSRVEQLTGHFDIVIARAFASPAKLTALTGHLLGKHGRFVLMVGPLAGESVEPVGGFRLEKIEKLEVPGEPAARNGVVLAPI